MNKRVIVISIMVLFLVFVVIFSFVSASGASGTAPIIPIDLTEEVNYYETAGGSFEFELGGKSYILSVSPVGAYLQHVDFLIRESGMDNSKDIKFNMSVGETKYVYMGEDETEGILILLESITERDLGKPYGSRRFINFFMSKLVYPECMGEWKCTGWDKFKEIKFIDKIEIGKYEGEIVYDISGTSDAKLFFIIPIKEKIKQKIDVDSGEVIFTKKSWWGFLAWREDK